MSDDGLINDIGESCRAYLLGRPSVQSLVSGRIYPEAPVQKAKAPFIVYDEIDSTSIEHLEGAAGLAQTRVQFDCFAPTKRAANDLRERVRLSLQGFRGGMGDHFISGCSVAGRHGRYEPPVDKSEQGRYVRSLDLLITHSEPVGSL